MPFSTINLGLTITIPVAGTRNWAANLKSGAWDVISAHDHSGSGNGKKLTSTALEDNTITIVKLKKEDSLGGFQNASTLAPAGTSQTVNFQDGAIQKLSLASASGDVTVTLSNPVTGGKYTILIIQGATPRDITWPVAIFWPQAQKPILSTGNGEIDKVELYYDGTNYFGDWNLDYS